MICWKMMDRGTLQPYNNQQKREPSKKPSVIRSKEHENEKTLHHTHSHLHALPQFTNGMTYADEIVVMRYVTEGEKDVKYT